MDSRKASSQRGDHVKWKDIQEGYGIVEIPTNMRKELACVHCSPEFNRGAAVALALVKRIVEEYDEYDILDSVVEPTFGPIWVKESAQTVKCA